MPKTKNISKPKRFISWLKPNTFKGKLLIFIILFAVVGGGYMLYSSFAASGAYLYITPATSTFYQGSTVTVTIRESSGSTAVNAIQANISYPTDKMQYVSTDETSSDFSIRLNTTASGNTVSIAVGSVGASLTGDKEVATLHFKIKSSTVNQTAMLNFVGGSAMISPTSNSDVLGYTQGATYNLNRPTGAAYMKVLPETGTFSYAKKPQIAIIIQENSGATPINVFQSAIKYPTNLLQYDHTTLASNLGQVAPPSINNGVLKIAGFTTGQLTGVQNVAAVFFNIKAAGTAKLSATTGSQIISATNNISIPMTFNTATYTLTKPWSNWSA